jgi:hypothetical protein
MQNCPDSSHQLDSRHISSYPTAFQMIFVYLVVNSHVLTEYFTVKIRVIGTILQDKGTVSTVGSARDLFELTLELYNDLFF